jgi:hypothetical protein
VRVRFTPPAALLQRHGSLLQCGGAACGRPDGAPGSSEPGGGSSHGGERAAWMDALDYCNGGPFFLSPDGQADWGHSSRSGDGSGGEAPAVEVLARYVGLPPGNLSRVDPRRAGSSVGAGAGAGGPVAAVSAVRCRVGAGAAVLCGTHPELEPSWLDDCGLTPAGIRASQEDDAATAAVEAMLGASAAVAAPPLLVGAAVPAGVAASGARPAAVAAAATAAAVSTSTVRTAVVAPASAAATPACPDAALARHTAHLRSQLAAHQAARDELLRMLLLAALMHQGGPGPSALAD